MHNPNHLLRFGVIGISALVLLAPARADQLDDLMRQLKAKGILNKQEYSTLSEQQAAAPPTPAGQAEVVDALMRQLGVRQAERTGSGAGRGGFIPSSTGRGTGDRFIPVRAGPSGCGTDGSLYSHDG